jgi:hypothetical protein
MAAIVAETAGTGLAQAMILSIEDYDKAEYEACATASYPALRAFSPIYFLNHGVPTNVTREIELARYVDMMGEMRAFDGWDKAVFDDQEVYDIQRMRSTVRLVTGELFGQQINPIANVLSPWPILRVVRHLSEEIGRPLNIFEGAAGCGYLGAYLIEDGHHYTGFDITQGLYLWQNRLWSALGGVYEWVVDGQSESPDAPQHWPWWLFATARELFRDFDVVICDSALGEMGTFGYHYFINAARRMVEHSEIGCLLMTSIGDPKNQQPSAVRGDLHALGFSERHVGGVQVFYTAKFPYKILDNLKPPQGRKLSEFFVPPDPLPDNYAFMKFAGLC